uniref:Uncharacterized protein n=1 Tax=Hucho hucho TaxID=62062 RepID=A0A4W5PTB7_9TELE
MALQGSDEIEERLAEPQEVGDDDGGGGVSISPAEEITLTAGPGGEEDAEPLLLPWDRFSAWLHCICVVGFDLELGQAVEVIYPHHSKLSEKEASYVVKSNVV